MQSGAIETTAGVWQAGAGGGGGEEDREEEEEKEQEREGVEQQMQEEGSGCWLPWLAYRCMREWGGGSSHTN